jgi:hypothetical protein
LFKRRRLQTREPHHTKARKTSWFHRKHSAWGNATMLNFWGRAFSGTIGLEKIVFTDVYKGYLVHIKI